ncbi:MAG: ABC transporter permease [Longimicrobiales bacterium]
MDLFIDTGREALRMLFGGDPYLWQVVLLSLRVSGIAVLLGVLIGVPIGTAVALARFRGRPLLIALIHTGFALPPVVVGLFVYMMLSRTGPAGGLDLLFTTPAMVLAQAVLAAPYVAGITLAAVQAVPRDALMQARALGATRTRAVLTILREARLGIGAAVVAGFGAVISEVGAVMLVGGNIAGKTRVMTTAIVLETRRGNFATAMALGLLLLAIAFTVNVLITRAQQGRVTWTNARGERPWR